MKKTCGAIVHYPQASRDEAMAGVLEVAKSSVEVWRIENFEKVAWPKDLYGQFFGGDSFLGEKPVDHFVRCKSDHFTKTGSGQTQGSAEGNGHGHSFS
jgi:hypothetical protein